MGAARLRVAAMTDEEFHRRLRWLLDNPHAGLGFLGNVYFARAGAFAKIGWAYDVANDVAKRLRGLQEGCPYRLELVLQIPGKVRAEREFHRLFADERVHGEWFRLSGRLAEFLVRVRRGAAELPDKTGAAPRPQKATIMRLYLGNGDNVADHGGDGCFRHE